MRGVFPDGLFFDHETGECVAHRFSPLAAKRAMRSMRDGVPRKVWLYRIRDGKAFLECGRVAKESALVLVVGGLER